MDLIFGAAAGPLVSSSTSGNIHQLIDTKHFPDLILPTKSVIEEGDLVVIMQSFDDLDFVYAQRKAIKSNRSGNFHHEDFIGLPFGSKIRSRNNRGYGFVYVLRPTPELWARSLNHRTQIVQQLDQAQIIFQLNLRPNMKVIESGTGSGAMSHGILRTIAPHGHLYTYEFNGHRAETAREEFEKHGLSKMVTVQHKDVCGKDGQGGGFDQNENSMDAVFLDLPDPWLAVPHAAYVLKPNARLASYSPCVEQTQRVVETLKEYGFHSIRTMEYRLQEHYVDEYEYLPPPQAKRIRFDPSSHPHYQGNFPLHDNKEDFEESKEASQVQKEKESSVERVTANKSMKKTLVARPFVTMKGHTAFLTFASRGNAR